MQEDIERRTVALSVNATKLTGRALPKILGAAVQKTQKEYRNGQTPQGKQRVKKLMTDMYNIVLSAFAPKQENKKSEEA